MKDFFKNLDPTIRNILIIGSFIILIFVGYGFYPNSPKEGAIGQCLPNSSRYDAKELGFSFQYPNSLFVSVDPDSHERLLILPQSLKTNKNEPMTAIVISTAEEDSTITAEDWINDPDSDYDANTDSYAHRLVGGQDATVISDDWIVFTTPDGRRSISVALLARNGAKPLLIELQEILDTFSFK